MDPLLERLDLPRLGHVLSIDIIVPLIVSMRNLHWKSLHNLRFPEEWASRDARNDQDSFREELERINQYLPKEWDYHICFECYSFKEVSLCDNCGMTLCTDYYGFKTCDGCNSCYCSECVELDDVDAADYCGEEHCYNDFCSACALETTECIACSGCVELHQLAPRLLAMNVEKVAEIVEMRNNNDALTNQNEQLRREIDELRKRKRD